MNQRKAMQALLKVEKKSQKAILKRKQVYGYRAWQMSSELF